MIWQLLILVCFVVLFVGAVMWLVHHNVEIGPENDFELKEPFDIREHRKTYPKSEPEFIRFVDGGRLVEQDEHEKPASVDGRALLRARAAADRALAEARKVHRGHRHRSRS